MFVLIAMGTQNWYENEISNTFRLVVFRWMCLLLLLWRYCFASDSGTNDSIDYHFALDGILLAVNKIIPTSIIG